MTPIFSISNSSELHLNGNLDRTTLAVDGWKMLDKNEQSVFINKGTMLVDLSGITHADSAGLSWLLNLKRDAKHHKVNVNLKSVPQRLIQLASLSSVDKLL